MFIHKKKLKLPAKSFLYRTYRNKLKKIYNNRNKIHSFFFLVGKKCSNIKVSFFKYTFIVIAHCNFKFINLGFVLKVNKKLQINQINVNY